MASNIDFVEYVCDQIGDKHEITYKKMFGEYGIYCNQKIIGLICNNEFFVKQTNSGKEILKEKMFLKEPYNGAKPHFLIENLDDRDFLCEFIGKTYGELPFPKSKKK